MERLLFNPNEAAAILGMGRSRVYDLMRSGALKSVKVGRSRRIHRDAIEAFIKSLTEQA